MKTELEALGFTGFYQGIWEQSENECIARQQRIDGDDANLRFLEFFDDWDFGEDYSDKVTKEYAERYVELVNNTLGTDFKLVAQSLWSPMEYNFQTDKIFCVVEIDDYDSLVDRLVKMVATNLELYNVMRKAIRENHTSGSGFISFLHNDINMWFGLIQDPDNQTYFSRFVGYLVNAMKPGCLSELNDDVYDYVECNTDWHSPRPQSEEAQEEYELYIRHGDLYIDFLKEYREYHINPNRKDWPKDNWLRYDVDWDEFKEAFSEYIEPIIAERERLENIRKQPVIPGLE